MGHAAGDELICGAADCIQKVFGAFGECYRTGGDEFIVPAHTDREKAEELIRQLAAEADAWDGKLTHHLSLSAGFALASEHKGVSAEKLIVFADKGITLRKTSIISSLKRTAEDTRPGIRSNIASY